MPVHSCETKMSRCGAIFVARSIGFDCRTADVLEAETSLEPWLISDHPREFRAKA
jgi:hypothetical protein